jgi:hypothetical protein
VLQHPLIRDPDGQPGDAEVVAQAGVRARGGKRTSVGGMVTGALMQELH